MRFSKIAVTGGAGFIGSHIVERLLTEGVKVTALDNLSTGRTENLVHCLKNPYFKFLKGDILDPAVVRRAVDGCEAVVHQAALVSVTRSVENPALANQVNVSGTLNLLQASLEAKVKRFVYASSSSVYGESEVLPKAEGMPLDPVSPYGVSKMAAESYCRAAHKVYGLGTMCLRYFNVYGPRQTVGPYSGVIPIFIGRLSRGEPPVIYGDGEQTRDFTNIEDVVEANILALEKDGVEGEVLNVGTGRPTSINQLADTLNTVIGTQLQPLHQPPRAGDIRHSYADIEKARSTLGYEPRVSLTEGLSRLVKWYGAQNSPNLIEDGVPSL